MRLFDSVNTVLA